MPRAEALLTNIQEKHGLSGDGKDWLISAVDPFHDSDIRLAGYPDISTGGTIVQLVKQQVQITKPGSLAAGANWDCQMNLFPIINPTQNSYVNDFIAGSWASGSQSPNTGSCVYGGFTCLGGVQGIKMWPTVASPNSTGVQLLGSASPSAFTKGNFRIIGAAFEVVNSTAEISKQGQVTVYRMPTNYQICNATTTISTTPTVTQLMVGMVTRMPPATISDANLLLGTRTWAAAEGAYVVARQNSVSNPMLMPINRPTWLSVDDFTVGDTTTVQKILSPAGMGQTSPFPDAVTPFDVSGAHFTGLSESTSLTVTIRWIVERLPGPREPDLAVLATPACPYDSLALEIFAQAMNKAPPGVMLRENPLGEWFKRVVDGVSNWAPKIGSALSTIGVPFAGGIGTAIGGGAKLLANRLENIEKKQKEAEQKVNSVAAETKQLTIGSASNLAGRGRSRERSRSRSKSRERMRIPATKKQGVRFKR